MKEPSARKLLDRLAQLRQEFPEQWQIVQQPHNYPDGTTHFTHVVQCPVTLWDGSPLTISIGTFLTPDLAELMTLSHNHLPDLITLARKGLDVTND